MQKTKEIYSKEKSAEYYKQNEEAIKEKPRERYKNLSQEQKARSKTIKKKIIIKNWFTIKKKPVKKWIIFVFSLI